MHPLGPLRVQVTIWLLILRLEDTYDILREGGKEGRCVCREKKRRGNRKRGERRREKERERERAKENLVCPENMHIMHMYMYIQPDRNSKFRSVIIMLVSVCEPSLQTSCMIGKTKTKAGE